MARQYSPEELGMTRAKPVGGDSPKASDRTKSGSGGKGGRKDVNPETKTGKSAITRSRGGGFGYYDDRGKYVSAFTDAIDGGGKNQSGTYFAGGPLSNILNVMKVAPKGSGDVPRERIGYRDLTDMFDQGGPQASGGGFRGAGGFSGIGNIANMLTGNQSERVGYYDEGGRFYEPPAPTPAPSGILNAVQNNDAPSPSYANMPMGEAGRGGIPMQARPAPSMAFGSTPVGGGMPAAPSMTFGSIPVGGGMPAVAQNMIRPEATARGMPASGMPQAARAALQGPSPQAGMPTPMTDDDAFRIMVSQLGQIAVDRMSGQQFIQTLNQIKSQGRGM